LLQIFHFKLNSWNIWLKATSCPPSWINS
jgi:hypothetical protein